MVETYKTLKKMRIVFITTYPKGTDGIAHYSKYLLQELRKLADIKIVCPLWRNNKLLKVIQPIFSIVNLYLEIKRFKPQVIHIEFTTEIYPKSFFLMFSFVLKSLRVPLVLSQHEINPEKRLIKIRTIFYEKILYRLVDAVIIHSEFARNELMLKGIMQNNIINIPHGVTSFPRIDKHDSRIGIGINKEAKVILFLGFLLPHKGVENIIKALPKILKKYSNTLLIVAGKAQDLRYLNTLKELVSTNTLEKNVIFTGYLSTERLTLYLSSADIMVLPYTSITQSGVLSLAIGAGIPVVTSKVGGLKEVVERHSIGLIVPPNEPEKIEQAILKLFSDTVLYESFVEEESKLAEKWSWKTISKMLYSLYDRLCVNTAS